MCLRVIYEFVCPNEHVSNALWDSSDPNKKGATIQCNLFDEQAKGYYPLSRPRFKRNAKTTRKSELTAPGSPGRLIAVVATLDETEAREGGKISAHMRGRLLHFVGTLPLDVPVAQLDRASAS